MQIIKVSGSGGFGGFLFWLLSVFANTVVFGQFPIVAQIGATTALGIAAALVGVYLLTASDMTQTRTYVFAMVCGIVWQPVLQAGKDTVRGVVINQHTNAVATTTRDIKQATTTQDPSQVSQLIQSAAPIVKEVSAHWWT